mgnify:CR=1 FL=1|tara:strand:- start:134 stop:631 length:498 start_codon:yes stop_codon:yes gene_type:complete
MDLILKPVPPGDYELYRSMIDNPNIARMTGSIPHPVDLAFVVERLETRAKEEAELGNRAERGIYVDGELVGGAMYFPSEQNACEIGYFVGEDHWGKGYATKAAEAIVHLARSHGFTDKLVAQHAKDNPASGRILEKIGFEVVGESISKSAGRDEPNAVWLLELEG